MLFSISYYQHFFEIEVQIDLFLFTFNNMSNGFIPAHEEGGSAEGLARAEARGALCTTCWLR